MAAILILGATGATGRYVVQHAASAGMDVTVLVRDPSKLPPTSRPIRVLMGDVVTQPGTLGPAIRDQDAVISTLGRGLSFRSNDLIARAAPAIVAAMEREGVRRLVFTSAFGLGHTYPDTPLLPRLFMATLLREIYADKRKGEAHITASGLDWTIVYPTGLTDGPMTGSYRLGERLKLSGFPKISRADVAHCLVRLVTERKYFRAGVLVSW